MKRKESEQKAQTKDSVQVEDKVQPIASLKSAKDIMVGKQAGDISAGAMDNQVKESTKTAAASKDTVMMDLDMTDKKEKSNLDGSKQPASKGKVSEQRKAEMKIKHFQEKLKIMLG